MIYKFRILTSFLILSCSLITYAQDLDLSSTDLSTVNIDALTDDQIQRFIERAEESGLTQEQLELVARQRGMSSTQISKLRTRIFQLQSGQITNTEGIDPTNRLRESYEEEEDQYNFFSFLSRPDSVQIGRLEIFGMNIFRSSSVEFEPSLNVATPDYYVLGAGDEIIIDVYGASEITYQDIISPDGVILISGLGPISLAGITVKAAKARIKNKLASLYSGVRGQNPNTFIQVSVGQVRSIKVNVVGNVVKPGTYTLSSFASAFNALYFAGGPTETGTMRNIEILRKGEKIAVLDVYKYLFEGDDTENPQLQDQDIVVVKPYSNRVKLTGNIKMPAIYELKDGETLASLFEISGGFVETAFKEYVTIDRVGSNEREVSTIQFDDFQVEVMQDGDSIFVEKILDRYSNRVKIQGAVNRPGYYELTQKLTLASLIDRAGGLRNDVYKSRGNIFRLNEDLSLRNLSFDIQSVSENNQDVLLSANDVIIIPSIFDIEERKILKLVGSVKRPGEYPFAAGMTVEDLISIAGGLKKEASAAMVEVARILTDNSDLTKSSEVFTFPISKSLGISQGASEFELQPFDLVMVKSSPFNQTQKVVKIEGEVMFPGYYALQTNEDKISDLIDRAGGLTEYGYAEGATLIRRTEYYRTEYQKEELDALIETKRKDLEARYNVNRDLSRVSYIDKELEEYERQLTEDFKKVRIQIN